jgi:hypothetical protein
MMKKLLREPLAHFVLLGALIFGVNAWRDRSRPAEDEGLPEIEVNAGTIAWLGEGFAKQWHRAPDARELRGLVDDHVREEILYREALAMGLDRNDTIVRRRMAQKVQFLGEDIAATATPDEAALRAFFEKNADKYAQAGNVSFRHIYFSKDRRGATLDADARAALTALAQGGDETTFGDPFIGELEFAAADESRIAGSLGGKFAEQVIALPAGAWQGPVDSTYGTHLVLVTGREPARPVAFERARDAVARDFAEDRRLTSNQDFLERLKARYRVEVDEAALEATAKDSTETAVR